MPQIRCPACANTRTHPSLSKNSYQLFECADCGHLFVSPIPTQELQALYTTAPYMDSARVAREPNPKFRERAAAIAALRPRGRVLDVGCAFGNFLMAAREHGLDAEGIELNPRTAKRAEAQGFAVVVGTMEDNTLPSGRYDAVHLGDVIEHVPEPDSFILACRRVFRPGGVLVVSTPRNDSAFARLTRRLHPLVPWSHATPPHHLQQFSLRSLHALLRRCDFEPRALIREAIPFGYELRATGLWEP